MRRFWAREYRDSHDGIKRRDGAVNGLYGGFSFWRVLRTVRHERKIAACGLWRGYKRREAAGEYRGMGKRKPAPGKPRAGSCQDFFAVSQITINGSSRINKMIKRGLPPPR